MWNFEKTNVYMLNDRCTVRSEKTDPRRKETYERSVFFHILRNVNGETRLVHQWIVIINFQTRVRLHYNEEQQT